MKYTKLKFDYEKFSSNETESMNGYAKDKLHQNSFMFVDTDKLEAGKEKFKKGLLKHYTNLINKINEQI